MNMSYNILVCDDDEDIVSALCIYLGQDGYNVLKAENGLEAVSAVESGGVHLILLDVMMPVMDGIRAAVKIRETSNVPILFLSAKSEDTDRILGLNMGGDDYITKPFNPVELLARVRAALRRYARLGGLEGTEASLSHGSAPPLPDSVSPAISAPAPALASAPTPAAPGVYQTGGLVLDDNMKRVTVEGDEAALTSLEYRILKYLMSNMEHVLSSGQIYEAVWEEPAFQVTKTVSVHVRHIREKIEINPKEPRYLKVIYGFGYKVVKLP
ncbi:MAG: response regulator transcription factor [Oscillospiraceae bacterium]|nr:response regulator transcription factor [Oscillospiraceae bacterium]